MASKFRTERVTCRWCGAAGKAWSGGGRFGEKYDCQCLKDYLAARTSGNEEWYLETMERLEGMRVERYEKECKERIKGSKIELISECDR